MLVGFWGSAGAGAGAGAASWAFAGNMAIAENAKTVLKKHHASSANRKSVKLGKIDKNTLYVVMSNFTKVTFDAPKVLSFEDLIGRPIDDPYGQSEEVYEKTYQDLEEGIKKLFEKINLWRGK